MENFELYLTATQTTIEHTEPPVKQLQNNWQNILEK